MYFCPKKTRCALTGLRSSLVIAAKTSERKNKGKRTPESATHAPVHVPHGFAPQSKTLRDENELCAMVVRKLRGGRPEHGRHPPP